ncbi:MAG: hypothetical protein ACYTAS_20530 [Planctomycetota bacterium]|jgi:hypothetical protein
MHRRSKKVLIGIGVVAIVLGAIYTFALVRSLGKLKRAYAALEEDGRPMQATEFIPPEVPDADNAAPLYLRAASMLKERPAPKKDLLEYLAGLSRSYMDDDLEPEKLTELRGLMAQEVVGAALGVYEEALQRPICRFERDYDGGLREESFSAGDLRCLVRISQATACFELEAGQADRAWDRIQRQFKAVDALEDDPLLWTHLFRIGTIRALCRTIARFSEIAPPGPARYRQIQSLLKEADDVTPLIRAVDAERLLRGEWLFNLPQDQLYEALRTGDLSLTGESGPEAFHRLIFRFVAFKPRFVADHARYLEFMRTGARLIEAPYAPPDSGIHRELGDVAGRHILSCFLTPAVTRFKESHCRMGARIHVTRAGMALLRHKRTHGAFPRALDALGLEGLVDPFTQKPLHYRAEGEGFVVYSVEADLDDNGGSERQPRQKTGYDLVWRYPRPTDETAASGQ